MSDGYPLMTPDAAAAYLHCTTAELTKLRKQGEGPPYVKIGPRTIRYQLTDVGQWKLDQMRARESADGRTNAQNH